MKSKKNQHVVPIDHGWAVTGEHNSRKTKITATKKEALERARKIAMNQKTELVIHNKNGKISDKDSFGNDPFPARDVKH